MSAFLFSSFFFTATATTEIYTLSLHDALPIFGAVPRLHPDRPPRGLRLDAHLGRSGHRRHLRRAALRGQRDRKSTRLNSSHGYISYAVFCLKKKKKKKKNM